MFALNAGMIVLKGLQAMVFYDGLASDVPEWSALYSVALWILFVIVSHIFSACDHSHLSLNM